MYFVSGLNFFDFYFDEIILGIYLGFGANCF